MPYEYSKLIGRIIEKFGTRAAFSRQIGISEHTVSKKLTGKQEWKQGEIEKACELLDISKEDVAVYFFKHKVQHH